MWRNSASVCWTKTQTLLKHEEALLWYLMHFPHSQISLPNFTNITASTFKREQRLLQSLQSWCAAKLTNREMYNKSSLTALFYIFTPKSAQKLQPLFWSEWTQRAKWLQSRSWVLPTVWVTAGETRPPPFTLKEADKSVCPMASCWRYWTFLLVSTAVFAAVTHC